MNKTTIRPLVLGISCALSVPLIAQESHLMDKLRANSKSAQSSTDLSQQQSDYRRAYEEEFAKFKAQYLKEFTEFKAKYNADLAAFRGEKLSQWGEADVSDKHKAVSYPEDDVKAVVDFESEQIVISVMHDKDSEPDIEKAAKALSDLQGADIQQIADNSGTTNKTVNALQNLSSDESIKAVLNNPQKTIRNSDIEEVTPVVDEQDIQLEQAFSEAVLAQDMQTLDILADSNNADQAEIDKLKQQLKKRNRSQSRSQSEQIAKRRQADSNALKNKRITRFRIQLPAKDELARVKSVSPFVGEHAGKWALPTELVVAIIHTESSFNPNAVSFVPAYGLMQIVPITAGVDVNDFLFKKRKPMKKETLFVANKNIEAGTAYFHLLLDRYLDGVSDPQTRLYCAIAAYNTGVGNVAATFHSDGERSLDQATLQRINSMTPEQVFDYMVNNLPYEETKKYLQKVKKRMKHYSQFV